MRFHWFIFAALFALTACSDDDHTPQASYVVTLAELHTDAAGKPTRFIPDGGHARSVTSTHPPLTSDSLYRVQAMALYEGNDKVSLRQLVNILSPLPRTFSATNRKYNPVEVLALWSSGRYINMRLALRTANEPHAFAFVEEGWDELDDGTRRLRLHLYHDRGKNPEYYTRETYLSCPIYHYNDSELPAEKLLRQGRDSIIFSITTYQNEHTLRLRYGD